MSSLKMGTHMWYIPFEAKFAALMSETSYLCFGMTVPVVLSKMLNWVSAISFLNDLYTSIQTQNLNLLLHFNIGMQINFTLPPICNHTFKHIHLS